MLVSLDSRCKELKRGIVMLKFRGPGGVLLRILDRGVPRMFVNPNPIYKD